MCPVKTQISLGIHPVWSESSLCTQWIAKDPRFLHTDSNDSDQIGQMPRLIWVFAGHTGHFVSFVMLWLNFFPVSKEELETLAITCHRICVVSSKKVLTEWQAWNELPHDKTNRLTCVPNEDSDQTGRLPSLIRVFADHMKKHWALNYLLSVQWRIWSDWGDAQVGGCPGWSESLLGTHVILLVLSFGGSYVFCFKQKRSKWMTILECIMFTAALSEVSRCCTSIWRQTKREEKQGNDFYTTCRGIPL